MTSTFVTLCWFPITKTFLKLKRHKARNNASFFLQICQDSDKVIFRFSNYNLNDHHEKQSFFKGLSFAIPTKTIEYSEFYYPLKCYLEILPAWRLVIIIKK